MTMTEAYYLGKFLHLDFAGMSPRARGKETFAKGLRRLHFADRDFDRMLNPSPPKVATGVRDREKESLEACRQWYAGWDEAQKEATFEPQRKDQSVDDTTQAFQPTKSERCQ